MLRCYFRSGAIGYFAIFVEVNDFECQGRLGIGECLIGGKKPVGEGGDVIVVGVGAVGDGEFKFVEVLEGGGLLSFLDSDISFGGGVGGNHTSDHQ